jgi:hypothetical protein
MTLLSIRTRTPDRKTPPPSAGPPARKPHARTPSPSEDRHVLIATRAYARYGARGYRAGSALDDWLEAEREILGQIPPV